MKSIEEKEIEFFMKLLKNDPINQVVIPKQFIVIAPDKITNGLRDYTVEQLQKEPNTRGYVCFRVPPAAIVEVCEVLAKYTGSL